MSEPTKRKRRRRETLEMFLMGMGACYEARKWCAKKTHTEAWRKCRNLGWMLWVLRHATTLEKTPLDETPRYEQMMLMILRQRTNAARCCALVRKFFPKPPQRRQFYRL